MFDQEFIDKREKEINILREKHSAAVKSMGFEKEPNRVFFEHDGMPCIIHRGPMLAWCGYVGVGPTHPAYKKNYDDVEVDVHGGLTYSNMCMGGICHLPKPGEPDELWWLGFDCSHSGDAVPTMPYPKDVYRTQKYVTEETIALANQLKKMTH